MKSYTHTTSSGLEVTLPLKRRSVLALMAGTATAVAAGPAWAEGDLAYIKDDVILGKPDAPVTVIEYASMTCGHCAHFHRETFDDLTKKYIETGKVKFVFREFPLDQLAFAASKMARCTDVPRFFPLISLLFKKQGSWKNASDPTTELAKIGRFAGIGRQKFEACLADKELGDAILNRRLKASDEYNVRSTPSFIVNGTLHAGAMSLEEFSEIIDELLPAS